MGNSRRVKSTLGAGWLCGVAAFLAVLWMAPEAAGQPYSPVTVESQGVATVTIAPEVVVFWLHHRATGATFAEAHDAGAQFEERLQSALEAAEAVPGDLAVSLPVLQDVSKVEVLVTARLRYSTRDFADEAEGLKDFAVLCDTLRALAAELNSELEGPELEVRDREVIEQRAIGQAIENAYPHAAGAAQVMRASVVSVENVLIQRVTWNDDPESRLPQPDLRLARCTARVRVSYALTAGAL
jgi:uncharacterized protein YggE